MKRSGLSLGVLIIALIFTAIPVYAAWAPAGLQGEDVTALAEDPGDATTWYAGTASGNVYKLTADTWELSSNGLPGGYPVMSIGIDPLSPSTVYAALGEAGIYRTLDGGDNWAYFDLSGAVMVGVEVDPYDSSIVFAISKNKVFRSVGGGLFVEVGSSVVKSKDIRDITLNPPDYGLNPLPVRTDVLYVASIGGMYRSVDGGDNWARLDTEASGIATVNFTALTVDPYQPDVLYAGTADAGVYKSADGGATWTGAANGLGGGEISAITFYPKHSTSLLVGTVTGEIYRTDSAGHTWYAWGSGFGRVSAIGFVYPQSTYILAATSDGVSSFDNSGPDLVVSSVSYPAEAKTEQLITITATVKNVGEGTAHGSIVNWIYISPDASITRDDMSMGVYPDDIDFGLEPGGERTLSCATGVRWNLATGIYYVGVITDDFDNVKDETDETNNAGVGNAMSVTRVYPDLVVTSVSGPVSAKTEQAITVAVTVKNIGEGGAYEYLYYTDIYLSTDATITTDDIYVWFHTEFTGLAPGEERTLNITVGVPWDVATGTYYLGAIVDSSNSVNYETDETNNAGAGNTIDITRVYSDLVVTSVSGPVSATANQLVTYTATVKNLGEGSPYPSCSYCSIYVHFYLSTDATITTDDIPAWSMIIGGPFPGQEITSSTEAIIPNNIAGTYYLGAIVDVHNYVEEADETNNTLAGNQITITQ